MEVPTSHDDEGSDDIPDWSLPGNFMDELAHALESDARFEGMGRVYHTPGPGSILIPIGPEWPDYALEELQGMLTGKDRLCPIRVRDKALDDGRVWLKDAHDVGVEWSELDEFTQAMLTNMMLESAMVIGSFMDISDLWVGEYCMSLESGGWSWMAARTWLWGLCGSDDWRVAAEQCEHWMSKWMGPTGNGVFMRYGLGGDD